ARLRLDVDHRPSCGRFPRLDVLCRWPAAVHYLGVQRVRTARGNGHTDRDAGRDKHAWADGHADVDRDPSAGDHQHRPGEWSMRLACHYLWSRLRLASFVIRYAGPDRRA